MTDTMMIVLGVICVIFVGYVAISTILIMIMLATEVYCDFYKKVKGWVIKYRGNKDE